MRDHALRSPGGGRWQAYSLRHRRSAHLKADRAGKNGPHLNRSTILQARPVLIEKDLLQRARERFEEAALFVGKVRGQNDVDLGVEVAALVGLAELRHA